MKRKTKNIEYTENNIRKEIKRYTEKRGLWKKEKWIVTTVTDISNTYYYAHSVTVLKIFGVPFKILSFISHQHKRNFPASPVGFNT